MGNGSLYFGVLVTIQDLEDLGFVDPVEYSEDDESCDIQNKLDTNVKKWFRDTFSCPRLIKDGSCCVNDSDKYFIVYNFDFGGIVRGESSCHVQLPNKETKDKMKKWCKEHKLGKPKFYIILNDCDYCT